MNTAQARAAQDLPEWFNATADLLEHNIAAGRGNKAAVVDHRGTTTYAELIERVDRMAEAFTGLGLRREARILLCLLDTADFPIAFLAAIKAGIVPVPLNTLLKADDYHWILNDSGADAVLVSGELTDAWREIAAATPHVRFFSSEFGPWPLLDSAMAEAVPIPEAARTHRDDVAFWLYTSGSTGRPKGAMHLQSSIRLSANLFGVGVAEFRESDVVFSVAKQFFAYGLGNSICFPYAVGATTVLLKDRATPPAVGELIRRHRVSILCGVPTFFAGWLASEDAPGPREAPALRLATSAGECLPAHIGEEFKRRHGVDIVEGLGSTEMLHIFLAQRPGAIRYGCTGKPVPGYEVRIVGDNGHPVRPGELGELQVKGPTAAAGYWRNRDKSLSTFQGEWTRTGDKYSCDGDGWYIYAGRGDDMLKVGGIYVSPSEVEAALACHEAVLECAVVGISDGDGLIKPRAHVVLRAEHRPCQELEAALKLHVKNLLAPYKYPRWIVFMDQLPKTATGKIQRYRLREP
jgi:benzoate-CoA ligase